MSVQFNNGGVFGGDANHLWDNTLKRLQVGTLPLGPLAPGPLAVGLVAPTGTGMQAGLFQTTTGGPAGEGLVTLGADNVAVSGWAFRGAAGSNPLYGGNFGVHFLGPGQVRGVEIDVQNEHADAGIGAFGHDVGLWLNRSGTWNSSSAIEISSQDNRGWWHGIHFDPGGAGTGSAPLIKGVGIKWFRAQPDRMIEIVPSDDANPDNNIFTVFSFDGTTKKAEIVKRGRFMGRGDSTGVTNPTFSFVDDPTTGVYTAAPSQVALGVLGAEVFKAVAAGSVTTGYGMFVGVPFASLGTPDLPAIVWCPDCQPTNPCTGGSVAGAWAFRVATNTSWSCTVASAGGGTITGTGTANTMTKFTAATVIGNSTVTDDGTTVTLTGSQFKFTAQAAVSGNACLQIDSTGLITKTGQPCNEGFSGETEITGTNTTASVTFASPLADTSYVVTLGTRPGTGTPPALLVHYTTKTVNGFTVELTAPPGSGNSTFVNWAVNDTPVIGVVGPQGPQGPAGSMPPIVGCTYVIGADNGGVITTADITPQSHFCVVPSDATVVEVLVSADAGTPTVVVAKNVTGGATTDLLSAPLSTASAGGVACANVGGDDGH